MTRGAQTSTLTPTRCNPDPACGLRVMLVTRELWQGFSQVGHQIDREVVHDEMHRNNDILLHILPQPVDPSHGSGLHEGYKFGP